MAKVTVRGGDGEDLHHGQKVYYRMPGQPRKKKGTIVSGSHEAGFVIQPNREGYVFHPPKISAHRDHIWTPDEHQAESAKSNIRETTSGGGSTISADESKRRAEIGQQRAQLSEAEVLQHPAFVKRMRAVLSHLAGTNGFNPHFVEANGVLHNDDPDANELYSEYITAAMNSYRTETSKAPQADLDELKANLEGKSKESRILLSMTRAGKTAALRHLMDNKERQQNENSYDSGAEDDFESGMQGLSGAVVEKKGEQATASDKAQLETGILRQLKRMDDPIAEAIVKMKFGLGNFEHGYKESDIAAALNRKRIPAPDGDAWDKEQVQTRMKTALGQLARTKGAQELRGFLKSMKALETLRKAESQNTVCVDFDGVIADYSQGFQGADIFGAPIKDPGTGLTAADVLSELKANGWKVIIFTTRQDTPALRDYLAMAGVPYDEINTNSDQPEGTNPGKPIADAYLDDRAVRFTSWDKAARDLKTINKSVRMVGSAKLYDLMDRFLLIKSHVRQYVRQDGSVVQAHDDKRIKKHQDILRHQNEHHEEIHTGATIKHGDELAEHLKNQGWKAREVHPVEKDEKAKPGKKEDMPEHEEIQAKNRDNPALQTAERGMKKMREAALASDDPAAVLHTMNTSRSNTYTAAVDDYREKLLNHLGYKVNRDKTATKYDKDGHTLIMSKDGDKHTIHFAGGDAAAKDKAIGNLQGKKEVQSVDTGKKTLTFTFGKDDKSYTAKLNPVHSKYALVEADDLTTSHTIQGHVNKAYPQEIQPRERERLSSQMQMANMMNDIKPELFTGAGMAAHGAPIVGKDGAVESGNGRTIALAEAYQRGLADHYKEHIKKNAADFGLKPEDVDKMKNPVLVRVRNDDDPNTDRAEFAREANDTGNLGSSPAEQAWTDASRIDDTLLKKFMVDEDGEVYNDDNMEFINGFLDKLGKNEAAGLRDADGDPNKKCIERIQNAVFTKVYGSSVLTELQAESAKPKIRNVMKALNACVPDFAQTQGHDDLDVVPDMMEAIEYTMAHQSESRAELEHNLRNAGALDFTGDTPKFKTDFAVDMILAVADRTGSRNRLENVFRAISNGIKDEVASRENPEVDMFSGPAKPKTKQQVVKQALDKVSHSDEGVRKSLCAAGLYLLTKTKGGTYGRTDRSTEVCPQVETVAKSTGRRGQDGRSRQEKSNGGEGKEETGDCGKEGAVEHHCTKNTCPSCGSETTCRCIRTPKTKVKITHEQCYYCKTGEPRGPLFKAECSGVYLLRKSNPNHGEHGRFATGSTTKTNGPNYLSPTAETKIGRGMEIARMLKPLNVPDLYNSNNVTMEEAKSIGTQYYRLKLMPTPINSPAFNGAPIRFTETGLAHLLGKHMREIPEASIKRRLKLLPKVKATLETTPFVDEIRDRADGAKEYGLLGRFTDGEVIRVALEEKVVGERTFLTVYDWEDVSKKIKRESQPNPLADGALRGVGVAPHATIQDNITKSTILCKSKNITFNYVILSEELYLIRRKAPTPNDAAVRHPEFLIKARPLHGRIDFNGLKVSVENRMGSIRQWEDPNNGENGMTRMKRPYGYVKGTLGVDGDHYDVYVGPDREAPNVYIITQMKAPEFAEVDEEKALLGFPSQEDAEKFYLQHYNDPRFLGKITPMPFEEFKAQVMTTRANPRLLAEGIGTPAA
ncbi:hypothetical protein [Oryzomonas rubra]|uniref:Uncharacterized protein n=1 Tax=Oryzomonas rubra TaxID=2509454 RepID=A0A5A9XAQ5_9BACT|nr:hypothetical protein [Oryzomonas rubra]KAA0888751.1 hypothetical protein ET418_15335 [Oryzomonas rubra]